MAQSTNSFAKGLNTDLHPVSTDNQTCTDALNATFITYNGNEFAIQNDMGNTKIQDSTTGNVMGLREGFIPVGIKEHGGIMYIASVNKKGEGEIGTIPSPIIRYNQESEAYEFVGSNGSTFALDSTGKSQLIRLTDEQVRVGEKMLVAIKDIGVTGSNEIVYYFFEVPDTTGSGANPVIQETSYYMASYSHPGLFELKLYSQATDQVYDLSSVLEYKL